MGYAMAASACFGCGKVFMYNPHRVPSFPDPKTMQKEPVCKECMELVNRRRVEIGVKPHPIHPDAYEPIKEEDL